MEGNKTDQVEVLIAGAGPAGLMMACQLAMLNISFRIIDKKSATAIYSGALIVHARTLEILDQMGLAKKAMEAGIIAQSIHLQFNKNKSFILDLNKIGDHLTPFPYILMLEQWKTEEMMHQFLNEMGHTVENNTPFLSFEQQDGMITSEILRPDGSNGFIKSMYLIGADGSHSSIRTQLNIPFRGKTQASRIFITDCEAALQSPTSEISFCFASNFTSGLFPLLGQRCRLDGHIPSIQHNEVNFEEVRQFFLNQPSSGLKLQSPKWFSVFRSHSRCADQFRRDSVFLIGDAAHVHSPVGAQGMNLGLQDAHNLAWKLAFVIKGKAYESLLNTYEAEHRPLAQSIIHSTDLAYSLMTSPFFLIRFLRIKVIPFVLPLVFHVFKNYPKVPGHIFKIISGLNIKYGKSFLSDRTAEGFPSSAPGPGECFPLLNFELNVKKVDLQDGFKTPSFRLYLFGNEPLPVAFQALINRYEEIISFITIVKGSKNQAGFTKLGIKRTGAYLVRPDNFICWRSLGFDAVSLENYLQKFMI